MPTLMAPTPESQLAALEHASANAIASTDTDGIVTRWSVGAARLSGFRAQQVVGRHIGVVVPDAGRGQELEVLARVIEQRAVEQAETAWRRPDGALLHVELVVSPIVGGDGEVVGASIIGRDVTARHRTERRLRESEERMRRIVDTAPEAIVGMDEEGRITGWNRAAEALFGWTAEEVTGRVLGQVVIPERLRAAHEAGVRRFLALEESRIAGRRLELRALHRDGHELPVELTLQPVRAAGRWAFTAFLRDLSPREAAEAARAHLAAIVESSSDAIVGGRPDGTITSWNPAAERLYGYAAAEAIGSPIAMLLPPGYEDEQREVFRRVLDGGRVETLATRRRHREGHLVDVEFSVSPIVDATGEIVGGAVAARDITGRLRAERVLEEAAAERLRRATRDELTGLPNRPALLERAAELLDGGATVIVAIADIDRFHELNDVLGREGGDAVLRAVAGALGPSVPAGGMVARLAGDQFGLLVPAAGDAGEAVEHLAAAVRGGLGGGLGYDELTLHVDVTLGVAVGPGDGDPETLLARAERALRAARRTRVAVERYDARRDEVSSRGVGVAGEFARALDRDEVVMHFQPQLDLRTGRPVAVEALVRWQHPERGLLGPGHFLPFVERSALMRRLTIAAIDQALGWRRRWFDEGLELAVSVNLSVLNLLDLEIAHDVAALLARHAVPAGALTLEITEDTLMVDRSRAVGVLAGLNAMGVGLAIDDFGTGYSSLAYLQRLPVQELKIDRAFVSDLDVRGRDAAIVRSTIDMARHLGLRVVAEGVESERAIALLAGMGCDLVQGYEVARPMPGEAIAGWVADRR